MKLAGARGRCKPSRDFCSSMVGCTALGGDLLLIVAPDTEDGDRLAQALSQNGQHAFVFAHDPSGAVAVASSLEPDLIVMALHGEDGIRACEQLRNIPETRAIRVLLVIDR